MWTSTMWNTSSGLLGHRVSRNTRKTRCCTHAWRLRIYNTPVGPVTSTCVSQCRSSFGSTIVTLCQKFHLDHVHRSVSFWQNESQLCYHTMMRSEIVTPHTSVYYRQCLLPLTTWILRIIHCRPNRNPSSMRYLACPTFHIYGKNTNKQIKH